MLVCINSLSFCVMDVLECWMWEIQLLMLWASASGSISRRPGLVDIHEGHLFVTATFHHEKRKKSLKTEDTFIFICLNDIRTCSCHYIYLSPPNCLTSSAYNDHMSCHPASSPGTISLSRNIAMTVRKADPDQPSSHIDNLLETLSAKALREEDHSISAVSKDRRRTTKSTVFPPISPRRYRHAAPYLPVSYKSNYGSGAVRNYKI